MKNQLKAYLTESEVATRLSVSEKWLQKMRYAGAGIPYHKFGRAVRYSIQDVEDFEARSRRTSNCQHAAIPLYTHSHTHLDRSVADRLRQDTQGGSSL